MSQELAIRPRTQVWQPKRTFEEAEIALLHAMYGKTLTNVEFKTFLMTAAASNLNPFAREIYCIKYGSHPMTLVTSIGGYRKMSQLSGRYGGLTEGELLVRTATRETITIKHREYDPEYHIQIISATIGVKVIGWDEPIYNTALFKTFSKNTDTWKTMPDVMILVRAEAGAHRKAALFPEGAVGIYEEGEIVDQTVDGIGLAPQLPPTVDVEPVKAAAPKPEPATPKRSKKQPAAEPPAEPAPVQDAPVAEPEFGSSTILEKLDQIKDFYWKQMASPEEGWAYALKLILSHFGVETPEEITNVEELRRFATSDLLRELRAECFLPLTKEQ